MTDWLGVVGCGSGTSVVTSLACTQSLAWAAVSSDVLASFAFAEVVTSGKVLKKQKNVNVYFPKRGIYISKQRMIYTTTRKGYLSFVYFDKR